jgi:ElaB/YqjD/DUF883 family membrane-anchored ribosome-binding protein
MQNTGIQGSSNVAEKSGLNLDRIADTAHQTVDRFASAASTAAGRLSEKSDELLQLKDQVVDQTRGYVKEHPLATVAIALAIGMLLSRLTRR